MKTASNKTALIIGKHELYAQALKKFFNNSEHFNTIYFYEPPHTKPGSIKNEALTKAINGLQAEGTSSTKFATARNLKTAVAISDTIVCLSGAAHALIMNQWVQPGTAIIKSWGSYDETWVKSNTKRAYPLAKGTHMPQIATE